MAEVNKEKQHISLNICNEKIDIYVKGDEETFYRDAEKLARNTYSKYEELFKGRRSFTLDYGEDDGQDAVREYSEETLKASQERLDRFLKKMKESSEE